MIPTTASRDDWATPLAAYVASIRRDWDMPGIRANISKARHRGTPLQIGTALLRLAANPDLRSPGMLADDGAHWGTPTVTPTIRQPRCPILGHEHELAAPHCRTCRSDELAAQAEAERAAGITPGPLVTTAQAARNLRGARAVLDAAPALDHARLAAGERDETDE